MTRRSRPIPAGGGQHFDAGDPRPPSRDELLDEMPGRVVTPDQDDPEARRDVVAWLVRLLGETRGR